MTTYRYTFNTESGQRFRVEASTLIDAIDKSGLTTLDDWTYIREPISNDIARPVVIRHD